MSNDRAQISSSSAAIIGPTFQQRIDQTSSVLKHGLNFVLNDSNGLLELGVYATKIILADATNIDRVRYIFIVKRSFTHS